MAEPAPLRQEHGGTGATEIEGLDPVTVEVVGAVLQVGLTAEFIEEATAEGSGGGFAQALIVAALRG